MTRDSTSRGTHWVEVSQYSKHIPYMANLWVGKLSRLEWKMVFAGKLSWLHVCRLILPINKAIDLNSRTALNILQKMIHDWVKNCKIYATINIELNVIVLQFKHNCTSYTCRFVLLGSNKGKVVLLKSETLETIKQIDVVEGKNCQIRSMVLSNNGQVCGKPLYTVVVLLLFLLPCRCGAVFIGQILWGCLTLALIQLCLHIVNWNMACPLYCQWTIIR